MAANIRCIMRAKAPYGQGITKMKVNLTPDQSSTPSLMPETNTVYLTRPTEGTGELMELVGGTVAWNQMEISLHGTYTQSGVTATNNGDGSMTINGTATATSNIQMSGGTRSITQGHCYLFRLGNVTLPTGAKMSLSGINLGSGTEYIYKRTTASTNLYFRLEFNIGTVFNNLVVWPSITDLTTMFGTAIADYAYTLEQQTAGAGIAWLQSYGFFTEDYIPYSAPTLQSVEASAHVTKDANNTVIATYPLNSDLVLRGIPKLSNGNLYYDGDTYEWDGTVTRRFAEVDLGTLSWTKSTMGIGDVFSTPLIAAKVVGSNTEIFNGVSVFRTVSRAMLNSALAENVIALNTSKQLIIHPTASYADAAAFKTAMSGVYLVYELADASQTTESADPFAAVQTVEDGGTEEFVTTNGVPVGVVGRFANAVPMDGVDSFTVTANDGTVHTYPVTLSEEIYRGYVDMLTGEAVSDMASIAEYNGETISEPWLSSLDVYSAGATPTNGAQVVYPITPEEVTATITGDPSELAGVVSATTTEGTVKWSELSEIGIKCVMKRKNPFQ